MPAEDGTNNKFVLAVATVVIGQSFVFGWTISSANSAETNFYQTYDEIDPVTNKSVYEDYWAMWVVAIIAFGAALGALGVKPMASKFGPKGCLKYVSLLNIIACGLIIYAGWKSPEVEPKPEGEAKVAPLNTTTTGITVVEDTNTTSSRKRRSLEEDGLPFELNVLAFARFLIGLFVGLASGLAPMYIMEISPASKRGMIGVLNQLFITVGIFIGQIAGLEWAFQGSWVKVLSFPLVISIIQVIVLPMIPESPRHTFINMKNKSQAETDLQSMRTGNIDREISDMQTEANNVTGDELSILEVLNSRFIRWQMISLIFLHVCQPMSGINAIFFYSNKILEQAGFAEGTIPYMAATIGLLNVVMTIISTFVIEKAGRINLMVYGFAGATLAMLAMIVSISLQLTIASLFCVYIFIVGFAIGPGPIPWIYNTELFEQNSRNSAGMIGCFTNWICNVFVGAFFPKLQESMGHWVFAIFMVVCVSATVYTKMVIPETKGKTFTSIYNDFASKNGVPVKEDDGDVGYSGGKMLMEKE